MIKHNAQKFACTAFCRLYIVIIRHCYHKITSSHHKMLKMKKKNPDLYYYIHKNVYTLINSI